MLQNNLDPEVAEHPDKLVVYGGTGKAARDWASFDALQRTLRTLKGDETMLVQSGRPVGVFTTHEWAPRVLIANSNLVGDWANWEEFRRLEHLGLTMYGQMTAGSWIYIGTQGILQGTYETFAAVAERHFGGTLAGTITLTAGLGGMGGAQPLAVTMNDGVAICIDCDPRAIARRIEHRYLDVRADSVEHALELAVEARDARKRTVDRAARQRRGARCRSCSRWTRRSTSSPTRPRRTTRCPTCRSASTSTTWRPTPPRTRQEFTLRCARGRWPPTSRPWSASWTRAPRSSTTATRSVARPSSPATPAPSTSPASCPAYIRPLFCEGKGPFRWAALSGDPADIAKTDAAILEMFPDNANLQRWIPMAQERVHYQGLPARICWLGYGERHRAGIRFNDMVASRRAVRARRDRPRPPRLRLGRLALPRDRGDGRRFGRHRRLAAAQRDGQRRSAVRRGCRSTTAAASASGGSIHAGQVAVADGTALAGEKLLRVLTNDPGMGVIRHVDAGYDSAVDVADERGVRIPMRENG